MTMQKQRWVWVVTFVVLGLSGLLLTAAIRVSAKNRAKEGAMF